MAEFSLSTEKIITSSQDIIKIAAQLTELRCSIENVKLEGNLNGTWRAYAENSIKRIIENVSDEAAKMGSLGDALQVIADSYKKTEQSIIAQQENMAASNAEASSQGTDKRNWWGKFWDWVKKREPDQYEATASEQEKAADTAMRQRIWQVLQDHKYSQENWDASSVENRKKILQDYMDEIISIYGLKNVKTKIKWDSNAEYSASRITWGYYSHGSHSVTLNAQALTDSQGNWDSYDLLETVSHELRHAYQHEAVDHPTKFMVSKETIDTWKKNFDNYIDSGTNYQQYRDQPVEVDARSFQVTRNIRP